jgi:GT2 family glycosyltransferase
MFLTVAQQAIRLSEKSSALRERLLLKIMKMPRVSLIIPTYEREEVLCDTIRCVLDQDFPDYEIVIIDQTKSHLSSTQTFLDNCPAIVRLIRHEPASLPGARNRGVHEARGEIIIMVDDDVILKNDFVSQHVRYYENPKIVAVAGRVEQEARLVGRVPSFLKSEFIQWLPFRNFEGLRERAAYRVAGCNFSFRKEAALETELFDENFIGEAWGEEYDFSLRLKGPGRKIVYAPGAVVFHLNAPTGGCAKRERFKSFDTMYSKPHNLAYLMEKNRLNRLYYLYLVWYVYRLSFMKREYVSLRGLLFVLAGQPHFVKGFVAGFKKGMRNVLDIPMS